MNEISLILELICLCLHIELFRVSKATVTFKIIKDPSSYNQSCNAQNGAKIQIFLDVFPYPLCPKLTYFGAKNWKIS